MNDRPMRHLGISLGTIGSLSDGLGEFSTQVCQRVAAVAKDWAAQGIRIHLHMPSRWHGRFGSDVRYLAAHKWQGYWHPRGLHRFTVWHGLNQLGRILPPSGTRHAILTIHDLNALYSGDQREIDASLVKLRRRLRSFDLVTTLTRHVEGDIRAHLGWTGPVEIIPNGARDLTRHAQDAVAGLAPGEFLLHLSRMSGSKNPDALIELAAIWPDQTLVMAGPRGPDSDRVAAAVRERGLGNVRVMQDVSDAQKTWLYANCKAFLFPSLTEGFGLPPIEAMHFGKPVFVSNLTSLPEICGDATAYFTRFEPHAMRDAIEANLSALQARPVAIRAHAARYNWDDAAARYMATYKALLDTA